MNMNFSLNLNLNLNLNLVMDPEWVWNWGCERYCNYNWIPTIYSYVMFEGDDDPDLEMTVDEMESDNFGESERGDDDATESDVSLPHFNSLMMMMMMMAMM